MNMNIARFRPNTNAEYIPSNEIQYSYSNNGYSVPDSPIYTEYLPYNRQVLQYVHRIYIRQVNLSEYEYQIYSHGRKQIFIFEYKIFTS